MKEAQIQATLLLPHPLRLTAAKQNKTKQKITAVGEDMRNWKLCVLLWESEKALPDATCMGYLYGYYTIEFQFCRLTSSGDGWW